VKPVTFSRHALDQLTDRGATQAEVEEAIKSGERTDAQRERTAFRKNFPHGGVWKGKWYNTKQVKPIVAEEP